MRNQLKSEHNKFTANWGQENPDSYTILKDGSPVARLVWDGNFSLNTSGEVELDPEDLIELCEFINGIKVDLYTEFPI